MKIVRSLKSQTHCCTDCQHSGTARNTSASTYLVLVIAMYEMRHQRIILSQSGPSLRHTWPNMEGPLSSVRFNCFRRYDCIHEPLWKIRCGRLEAFSQVGALLTLERQVSRCNGWVRQIIQFTNLLRLHINCIYFQKNSANIASKSDAPQNVLSTLLRLSPQQRKELGHWIEFCLERLHLRSQSLTSWLVFMLSIYALEST